ncbi:MAG: methionyl-tRNA formyltransferase [Acidimicrobiia bacterium]|nr:methionyl-tRNA formyltransferase [Acidimicrobiia bacterium]MDH5504672.1 methionyl-tRNA formyltransferase [Acidimicrobiia bacterium]
MRAVFFGTPEPATASLEALVGFADVVGVVTRPDAARGRSKKLQPSPVAEVAARLALPIFKPSHGSDIAGIVAGLGQLDVGVVVAFGMLLSSEVLAIPRAGLVNVHFSLLPRWRGAAPVERAILAGDEVTGVSIMSMDVGLDTGPVIATSSVSIDPDKSAGELTTRLAAEGASLLSRVLPAWTEGQIEPVIQDESAATYAHKLTTSESRLDLSKSAEEILRSIRAFEPRPGAHAYLGGDRFKIRNAAPGEGPRLAPGELHFDGDRLWVGTGTDPLVLRVVQPPGKAPMDGADWARGRSQDLGSLS